MQNVIDVTTQRRPLLVTSCKIVSRIDHLENQFKTLIWSIVRIQFSRTSTPYNQPHRIGWQREKRSKRQTETEGKLVEREA